MDREFERRGTRVLLTTLTIWGLAVALAAEAGVDRLAYPLLRVFIIALSIAGPVIVYALSAGFRAYIEGVGLRSLTALHIWRVAAAVVFCLYGELDLLPETFVRNAGLGGLFAGLFALAVIMLPYSRVRYLAFHITGFADVVLAVGTGLAFFLLDDPRMSEIQTLPIALIPFFGVGISGASHIMAFDLLRRGAGSEMTKAALEV